MARVELPPPVHILLAYAADGWAAENGQFNSSGKPKPPEVSTWLPVARALLREPDGSERLRDLALIGMAAWNVDPSIMISVVPAFATPYFATRLARWLGIPDNLVPDSTLAVEPTLSLYVRQITKSPTTSEVMPLSAPRTPKPRKT